MDLVSREGHLSELHANQYTGSLSENTRLAYTRDLKDFFGVADLTDITIDMIKSVDVASAMQFREKLVAEGYKPSTINRKLTSISKFYSFLKRYEVGIVAYNPFSNSEGLSRIKYNKQYSNTRCLTVQEVKIMVNTQVGQNELEVVRNRIIILLLATTGMRRSEIVGIKIGDIRKTQGKEVIEIIGKGEKERMIVISDAIKALVDQYLAMREITYADKDKYLLISHSKNAVKDSPLSDKTIYNVIKATAEKAGIETGDLSPHCFRHTYITESLDMGVKIEDVQDMVGHSSIVTTRRYDHTNRILKNNPADALTNMFLDD